MPALDMDSQFKFLVSCIQHSTAGKVDFVAVANELNIVSKAAAAKRYERLLKAHRVAPGGGRIANNPTAGSTSAIGNTPSTSKSAPKARTAKKRKTAATPASDDDEDVKMVIGSDSEKESKKGIKKEIKKGIKKEIKPEFKQEVKDEFKDEFKPKKEKTESLDNGSSIPHTIPEAPQHGENGGGDNDPCLLCTTEQTNGYVPVVNSAGASQPANYPIAGIHSFDYATNMNFHPQTMIPTTSEGLELNNFAGSAWLPHPESQHFYWGMVPHETSENGHQA